MLSVRKKENLRSPRGGTIFLDEIGELELNCQVKLLRALEEGEIQPVGSDRSIKVEVRAIAATNVDLREAVRKGTFREDLFHRLFMFPMHIPALRERKEDIPLLVEYFTMQFCQRYDRDTVLLSEEAVRRLLLYDWPGNVRELRNCLQRAIISTRGSVVEASNLVFTGLHTENVPETLEDMEKQLLENTLRSSRSIPQVLQKLQMARSTFYDKMRKHNLGNARDLLDLFKIK